MGRKPFVKAKKGRTAGKAAVNQPTTKKERKSLSDYVYEPGTREQSELTKISKYLINHIRQKYEYSIDICQALEDKTETVITQPTLQVSSATDADAKKSEEKQNNMIFKAQIGEYLNRKRTYEANKVKAYGFLFEHCSKAMKNKIEIRDDFESDIKNDPIELLNAIEELSTTYKVKKYHHSRK